MGKKWKQCRISSSWAPKSEDSDWSHEVKRHLILGRIVMTNLDSILKSRDIILLTKIHIVKAMVFSIVMYGCESWTIKNAECWRIDAFELWCWRRLSRVPWTARRSNQSILKKTNPEYSLEGLMLKLKFQYFGHLMWLIGKDLDAGKDWGQEEKWVMEDEMVGWHQWLNGHEFEQTLEILKDREAWHAVVHRVAKSQTQLSDWTIAAFWAEKGGISCLYCCFLCMACPMGL